jgi:hypothetical protein
MFKELVLSDNVLQLKLKEKLSRLTSDVNWNERLEFILNKYKDRDAKTFDINFLYMLTYSLRSKYTQSVKELYNSVYKTIFEYNILPGSDIVLLTYNQNDFYKISSNYGQYISNLLERMTNIWLKVLQQLCCNYKIVRQSLDGQHDKQQDGQQSIKDVPVINLLTLFNINVPNQIFSIEYSTAKNKTESVINNIILNLFNCCYGDTITDGENYYQPVNFNIVIK